MIVVRIGARTHQTFGAVLLYLEKILTEQNIVHTRMLFQYKDKHDNLCDEDSNSLHKPVHIVSPKEGPYSFSWKGDAIEIRFECLDKHHLYKARDMSSVMEPQYEILLESSTQEILDAFMLESLHYLSQCTMSTSTKSEIMLYQFHDGYWDSSHLIEKRHLDTIYLPHQDKETILKDLQIFLEPKTRRLYSQFGIPYHRTYCLYGPPGTGKSSLILALASECDKNVAMLTFTRKFDNDQLVRAMKTVPRHTFLVLEDIDCLIPCREEKNHVISFSSFLNSLDGIQSNKEGLVIFMTTNCITKLDSALCRPGRIDYMLEFFPISKCQVFQMLHKFFPSQSKSFPAFYEKIKRLRLTTCTLQKYLFHHYPHKDILEDMDSLEKDAQFYKWDHYKDLLLYG